MRARRGRLRWLLRVLGPGLITGASDDDPSGVATYAAAGAAFGYGTLWTALVTFPLMAVVQFVCAKVGMVSGCGLAGAIRQHYPRWVYPVVLALVVANTINAAADLSAVAAGINLLVPISIPLLVLPVGLGILAFQVWGSYRLIARTFTGLSLCLLAYIGAAFLAGPDWWQVARGALIPSVRPDGHFLMMLVAILGTTISPYLFFWQANQEVEEEAARGRKRLGQRRGATAGELRDAAWDVGAGMFLSNVVMFFIILATAATLHQAGRTEVGTAAEAAEALRPLAGDGAFVLMALGLIGTGALGVPVLTGSAAYATAEAFGWPSSLDARPRQAARFYAVMAACTAGALAINYLGIDPIKALVWTSVINGFLSPPLLALVLLVANDRAVMGRHVNGWATNLLGWATAAFMALAAGGLVWSWCRP